MTLELTQKQACERLKISQDTLTRRIKAGAIPTRKADTGLRVVTVLLEVPDTPAPDTPKVAQTYCDAFTPKRRGQGKPKGEPEPTPEPVPETPDELFARRYRAGETTDSFGNYFPGARNEEGMLRQTVKLSALGPSPVLPAKEVVQDASQGPLAAKVEFDQGGKVKDAGWWHDERQRQLKGRLTK